ncbi:MAG: hypothetical protein JNL17_16660 [Cyclobacteriaceae bacterium]|nr:hypothetical protein [Cyclobacteriaceae bacterium]
MISRDSPRLRQPATSQTQTLATIFTMTIGFQNKDDMSQILLLTFIVISFSVSGQTRTVTGKVIDEYFENLPGVRIQNSDTIQLGTTDINGEFKIEIPVMTDSLLFGFVGMEWTPIKLTPDCDRLEIIMMVYVSYHDRSSAKIDRLRKKRYDNLDNIHLTAFNKGQFLQKKPCYTRDFLEHKQSLDKIERDLIAEQKRIKDLFEKMEIGDTVKIPYSPNDNYDGTKRTFLFNWSYVSDNVDFKCIIEGVILEKDKRKKGYNITYKVTNCEQCKYESLVFNNDNMTVGRVLKHNMKVFKVLEQ